jgi:hypothetical protein
MCGWMYEIGRLPTADPVSNVNVVDNLLIVRTDIVGTEYGKLYSQFCDKLHLPWRRHVNEGRYVNFAVSPS